MEPFSKTEKVDRKEFQPVICIKDNQVYVYKIDENPCFLEDFHSLIKCFQTKRDEEPDFSKEVEIYGKYLVSAY
jgi:hypothetical protein